MGNIASCCAGETSHGDSKSSKNKKMVPADLHSSSAQVSRKGTEQRKNVRRPNTLLSGSSSHLDSKPAGSSSKYSGFSLHGVQKTSPIEHSDENISPQQKSVQHKFLVKNVVTFFEKYKDKYSDAILDDGIIRFCNDLEVDPAEFIVLALAWKFKASMMCKFTREEFTQGCVSMQVDSIKSMIDAFPALEKEALAKFRDIYKFAFQFGLDIEQGQRSLPCDVAIGMWQVVFSKKTPPLLNEWIKFLGVHQVRGISRDTWNMFLHFTDSIATDLNNYDDSEAWPSLFDDFVEYYRALPEKLSHSDESSSEQNSNNVKIDQESGEEEQRDIVTQEEGETSNSVSSDSNSMNESQGDKPEVDSTPSEEEKESIDSEPLTTDTLHSSHAV